MISNDLRTGLRIAPCINKIFGAGGYDCHKCAKHHCHYFFREAGEGMEINSCPFYASEMDYATVAFRVEVFLEELALNGKKKEAREVKKILEKMCITSAQ